MTTRKRLRAVLVATASAFMIVAPVAHAEWTGFNEGDGNVGAGPSPFGALTPSADNNVVLGANMMPALREGDDNVAVGNGALQSTTTGDSNVGVGSLALGANTTGFRNTAVGRGNEQRRCAPVSQHVAWPQLPYAKPRHAVIGQDENRKL